MAAPVSLQCPSPGCGETTETLDPAVAIKYLEMHVNLVHGNASKPEKPKRPQLLMPAEVVEHRDWAAFKHQFDNYKKLANISGQASNHLLECLAPEVYKVLFDTYGETVNDMTEKDLLEHLEHLIVRKRNKLASVMELLAAKQDTGQKILAFLAQLKSKGRHCQLSKRCECGKEVDYTEEVVLFRLVAGVSDLELQEDLLKVENLNLEEAEKLAVAKESAKSSQAEMVGDTAHKIKSEYMQQKLSKGSEICKWCGGATHKDRLKECPAQGKECTKCGKLNHFRKQCLSKSTKIKNFEMKKRGKTSNQHRGNR